MPAGNLRRNNHTVPEFHLRQFGRGTKGESVWTYNKITHKLEQRSVQSLVARSYYITEDCGDETDVVEQLLTQFESDAAPIITYLCTASGSFALSPQQRVDLAEYIGLLHTRVPAVGEIFKQYVEVEVQRQLAQELRDPKRLSPLAQEAGVSDSEFEAWRVAMLTRLGSADRLRVAPVIRLGAMMAGLRWIAPQVASMRWTVFKRYSFPHLLLGDNPAAIPVVGDPDNLSDGLPGLGAFMAIPLDPCTVLAITHVGPEGRVRSIDDVSGELRRMTMGSMFPDEQIALDVGLRYSWLAWKTSDRWVVGSTEADLRAIYDRLPPEDRDMRGGGELIAHVAPEE